MIKIKSVEKNSTSYRIISNIEKDKICIDLKELKKELVKIARLNKVKEKNWKKDFDPTGELND
ncbi:hypothetical protein LCGC14_1958800 [marine sediment metagenome]|uniref:Uncharacterized protein n=1 Tax=marine sediment metagenome TaxID=412755 RepID=A0A0F9FFF9_9ZZZZ